MYAGFPKVHRYILFSEKETRVNFQRYIHTSKVHKKIHSTTNYISIV